MPTTPATEPPAEQEPRVLPTVSPDELLMRRVLNQPKQYKSGRPVPLQEGAFLPGKRDDTGLSLTRRQSEARPEFLTPDGFKARCSDPKIRETAGVVQLLTSRVTALGVTVNPDPVLPDPDKGVPGDSGHVLLPEINFLDFAGPTSTEETRSRIRLWAAELVPLAEAVILPG